jgi:hypothetical protein
MTDPSESADVPGDQPSPPEPTKPKRGAFPTPKSDIEKAQPYVPVADEVDDGAEAGSADADAEKGG